MAEVGFFYYFAQPTSATPRGGSDGGSDANARLIYFRRAYHI